MIKTQILHKQTLVNNINRNHGYHHINLTLNLNSYLQYRLQSCTIGTHSYR